MKKKIDEKKIWWNFFDEIDTMDESDAESKV